MIPVTVICMEKVAVLVLVVAVLVLVIILNG